MTLSAVLFTTKDMEKPKYTMQIFSRRAGGILSFSKAAEGGLSPAKSHLGGEMMPWCRIGEESMRLTGRAKMCENIFSDGSRSLPLNGTGLARGP